MGYHKKVICSMPGCNAYAEPNSKYCAAHSVTRGTTSQWKKMYGNRWEKRRKDYLAKHYYCEECLKLGIYTPADTIHHKIEHKGDEKLFWDESNWEAICRSCHSKIHMTNLNERRKN